MKATMQKNQATAFNLASLAMAAVLHQSASRASEPKVPRDVQATAFYSFCSGIDCTLPASTQSATATETQKQDVPLEMTDREMLIAAQLSGSFDFWNDPKEDIYNKFLDE